MDSVAAWLSLSVPHLFVHFFVAARGSYWSLLVSGVGGRGRQPLNFVSSNLTFSSLKDWAIYSSLPSRWGSKSAQSHRRHICLQTTNVDQLLSEDFKLPFRRSTLEPYLVSERNATKNDLLSRLQPQLAISQVAFRELRSFGKHAKHEMQLSKLYQSKCLLFKCLFLRAYSTTITGAEQSTIQP